MASISVKLHRGGGSARRGGTHALLSDAADAFSLIERVIEEEKIECFWRKAGRFAGAWTPKHYAKQAETVASLNDAAQSGRHMVPRERQREEIASDFYRGGMVVERSASCIRRFTTKACWTRPAGVEVPVCAMAPVGRITDRHRMARGDGTRTVQAGMW